MRSSGGSSMLMPKSGVPISKVLSPGPLSMICTNECRVRASASELECFYFCHIVGRTRMDRSFGSRVRGGAAAGENRSDYVCTCRGGDAVGKFRRRPARTFIRPKLSFDPDEKRDEVRAGGAERAPSYRPLQRNNTSYPVRITALLRALYKRYTKLRGGSATEDERWAALLKYYQ